MRYSELAGKEIIDISEGTRMGIATSTDLMLDTATGTVAAMVIFQRSGLFAVREIAVPWAGIRKIGRDLIIVDMSAATEQELSTAAAPIRPAAVRRVTRHRVPGMEDAAYRGTEDDLSQYLMVYLNRCLAAWRRAVQQIEYLFGGERAQRASVCLTSGPGLGTIEAMCSHLENLTMQ